MPEPDDDLTQEILNDPRASLDWTIRQIDRSVAEIAKAGSAPGADASLDERREIRCSLEAVREDLVRYRRALDGVPTVAAPACPRCGQPIGTLELARDARARARAHR
jgi:hypothetical protein